MTRMPLSALTPIVDGKLWTFERPVWFSGVRQRVRTTVVRLDDGSLLLHSPAPPRTTIGPFAGRASVRLLRPGARPARRQEEDWRDRIAQAWALEGVKV